MAISLSNIENLNSYQVKQILKLEREQLPKFFCLNRKTYFSIVKNTVISKIHRINHLILHRIWINEKKINEIGKNGVTFTPSTINPTQGVTPVKNPAQGNTPVKSAQVFSRVYGAKQIGNFPRFSDFVITAGSLIIPIPSSPVTKIVSPVPERPSISLQTPFGTAEIQQIKNQPHTHTTLFLQNCLVAAAIQGELDFVKWLIETHQMELDFFDNGNSPLCAALAANQPEIAAFLLSKGASAKFSKQGSYTPLELAIIYDMPELTVQLIQKGAMLHDKAQNGYSLVEIAVEFKNHKVLKVLLDQGAKIENTALLKAIAEEDLPSLKLFLENHANPAEKYQDIPLYIAALQATNPKLIELMLQHGLNYQDQEGNFDDEFKNVLLSNASPDVLEFFIQHKALKPEFTKLNGAYNYLYLMKKAAHLEAFHRQGFNPKSHEDWLKQKFLAHRFDVKAQTTNENKQVSLDGFNGSFTIPEIHLSLTEFFNKNSFPECPEFTQNARQNILESFQQWVTDGDLLPKDRIQNQQTVYQQGKLVLVKSGFKDHAYYRVLYKGVIAETNRGRLFETTTPPGAQLYKIVNPSVAHFSQMESTEKALIEESQIRQALHAALKSENILCFKYKPHKTGICAWAGLKTAFRMMLYLTILEELQKTMSNEKASEKAEIVADKIYKKWSAWDRENDLQKSIHFYNSNKNIPPNKPLLKEIEKKFKGSPGVLNQLKALINL